MLTGTRGSGGRRGFGQTSPLPLFTFGALGCGRPSGTTARSTKNAPESYAKLRRSGRTRIKLVRLDRPRAAKSSCACQKSRAQEAQCSWLGDCGKCVTA